MTRHPLKSSPVNWFTLFIIDTISFGTDLATSFTSFHPYSTPVSLYQLNLLDRPRANVLSNNWKAWSAVSGVIIDAMCRATPAISDDLGSSAWDWMGVGGWLLTADTSCLEKEFISSSRASRDTSTVPVVLPDNSSVRVRSKTASRVSFLIVILFHRDLEAEPQINLFKVVLKSLKLQLLL